MDDILKKYLDEDTFYHAYNAESDDFYYLGSGGSPAIYTLESTFAIKKFIDKYVNRANMDSIMFVPVIDHNTDFCAVVVLGVILKEIW